MDGRYTSSDESIFDGTRASGETKATNITRPSIEHSRSPVNHRWVYEEPESYGDEQEQEPDTPKGPPRIRKEDTFDRPPLVRSNTVGVALRHDDDFGSTWTHDPRSSTSTYASTDLSEEEEDDRDRYDAEIFYDDDEYSDDDLVEQTAQPSSPKQFGALFPSTRRLRIHHDDQSKDGNVNLRVDTHWESEDRGRPFEEDITLFHLKMNDLKTADFSLRRYCRESGREVCKYKRVSSHQKQSQPESRPGSSHLQRSVSNVFSTLKRGISGSSTKSNPARHDSGYGSSDDHDDDDAEPPPMATRSSAPRHVAAPPSRFKTDPPARPSGEVKLEFSNYQHLDVKRHSNAADTKRKYTFEHWGSKFYWRRYLTYNQHLRREEVTLHLIDTSRQGPQGKGLAVAKITPADLSLQEYRDEQDAKGWVQQSNLQITDKYTVDKTRSNNSGLGDVIVATGLLALVDDTMLRRWHSKDSKVHYVPGTRGGIQLVTPRTFINEVFHRRDSADAAPSGIATAARRAILGPSGNGVASGRSSMERKLKGLAPPLSRMGTIERSVTDDAAAMRGRQRSRLSEEIRPDGVEGLRGDMEKVNVSRPTPLKKGITYHY